VRFTGRPVPAFADDGTAAHQYAADPGIRMRSREAESRQLQCASHVAMIVVGKGAHM
jgi:hypothetical protein